MSTLVEKLLNCSDLSTWENWLPGYFDYNSIQSTIILEGAFENSLTSKLLLFTKIWPNNWSIATELVLPWIYVAITKIKHQLMVVQKYLLSILVQFKVHTVCYNENIKQISETHSELCETCMMERLCENNEQLKRVPSQISQDFKYANGLNFKNYSIHFTSRTKKLLNETVEHAQMTKFQNISRKKVKFSQQIPLVFLEDSRI